MQDGKDNSGNRQLPKSKRLLQAKQSYQAVFASGMDSRRQALQVCVCGAGEDQATLLLQAVAAGHVFGPAQPLTLTLHGGLEEAYELADEALELQDACFPLVMGVKAETDLTICLSQSDIVVLILQTTGLDDMLPVITEFAATLNKTPRTRQKAVIVVGQRALPAADVLCILAPELSRHLVTAVELPHISHPHSQLMRGGYQLAETVSKHVNSWWSALQMNYTVTKGIRFQSIPSTLGSWFLPLLTRLTSQESDAVTAKVLSDLEHDKLALQDFIAAVQRLQLTDAQLVMSAVSCQL